MTKYLMMVSVALFINSCATHAPVHQPASELEQRIVKGMHIPDNQSRVIFYLGDTIGSINVGSRIPMDILIDGKFIGNLGRRSEMVVADLTPGKHTLLANGMAEFSPETTYLTKPTDVNFIAGKQSFYRVTLEESTATPSKKIFGISSPLTEAMTYAVSLKKDDRGVDDLSYHTVVAFYTTPSTTKQVKPIKQATKTSTKPAITPQEKTAIIPDDIEVKMIKIKEMHKKGLITQSEYDSKRKSLLESY